MGFLANSPSKRGARQTIRTNAAKPTLATIATVGKDHALSTLTEIHYHKTKIDEGVPPPLGIDEFKLVGKCIGSDHSGAAVAAAY